MDSYWSAPCVLLLTKVIKSNEPQDSYHCEKYIGPSGAIGLINRRGGINCVIHLRPEGASGRPLNTKRRRSLGMGAGDEG